MFVLLNIVIFIALYACILKQTRFLQMAARQKRRRHNALRFEDVSFAESADPTIVLPSKFGPFHDEALADHRTANVFAYYVKTRIEDENFPIILQAYQNCMISESEQASAKYDHFLQALYFVTHSCLTKFADYMHEKVHMPLRYQGYSIHETGVMNPDGNPSEPSTQLIILFFTF